MLSVRTPVKFKTRNYGNKLDGKSFKSNEVKHFLFNRSPECMEDKGRSYQEKFDRNTFDDS